MCRKLGGDIGDCPGCNIQAELDRRAKLAEKRDQDLWDGTSAQPDLDDAAYPIEEG